VSRPLYRSHRVFGYEVARAFTEEGTELVVLQTAPHKHEAAPAHTLMAVTPQEAAFEAKVRLIAALEHARFLGLDGDALRRVCEEALEAITTQMATEE
jgi:hypothetical protein